MRRLAFACTALFITAAASAQTTRPVESRPGHVPPAPRDGEGAATVTVPILIYHAIRPYYDGDSPADRRYIATPQTLERELAWLRENGFQSVAPEDLARALTAEAELPAHPVILTFDDCWENHYTTALPLLRRYGFTATFYAWVGMIGRTHHLTWDQLQEISDAGMRIGCHTMTHPYLTRAPSDAELRWQLADAKHVIEAHLCRPVTSLAYPFGQYDERVVAFAREAGFTTARSTWPGVVHDAEGLLSLTGLIRTDSAPALEMELLGDLERARRESASWLEEALGL
jgi:peptidoglycan/xylan/chitin deacetylase (PgdA/CDA1 family)